MTPKYMPKWIGKRSGGLHMIQMTIGNQEKLGSGEVAFHKEEHSNQLSTKWSALKTVMFMQ